MDLKFLQRDHGGEGQGDLPDDGRDSYAVDARHFDLVHIDPWKAKTDYRDGLKSTIDAVRMLDELNPRLGYEVGTEEAIRPMTAQELDRLILGLKSALPPALFGKIAYAVIQSGTSLLETQNTGNYNPHRLQDMLAVCSKHGLKSKEHNGDYLDTALIRSKFDAGLDALNIAPEFGKLETETAIDKLRSHVERQQRAHAVVTKTLPHLREEERGQTAWMTEEAAIICARRI